MEASSIAWAEDVRIWVAMGYTIMVTACIIVYLNSRNGKDDGFAQRKKEDKDVD